MTQLGGMARAVAYALKAVPEEPRLAATRALARTYATAIDGGSVDVLNDLGPKLLATLTALGMTVQPGAATGGAPRGNPVANTLDELRARRAKRARPDGA